MFGSRHGPLHPELAILCSAGGLELRSRRNPVHPELAEGMKRRRRRRREEEEEGGEEGQNLETSPGRWGKMFKNQKNRKYAA